MVMFTKMKNIDIAQQCWDLVLVFFNFDKDKTQAWFECPNPHLGGTTPVKLIQMGREHKVLQFIQNSLNDNIRK